MSDKLTISAGTDADDNASITATMQDETGNPVDTIVFSATNPEDMYSSYVLKTEDEGNGVTRNSFIATRYGKLVILKGINIQNFGFGIGTLNDDGKTYKFNTESNGFMYSGFTLPKSFCPRENGNVFFYEAIPWHDKTVLDSPTYWISIMIHSETGRIYARLERNILASTTGHGSRHNVNFVLPYFTE